MLGHIGVNVTDLPAAGVYDDRIMPLLGFETYVSTADQIAYRPAQGKRGTFIFFYPSQEAGAYSRHQSGLQHLAFMVGSRTAVREVHDHVREAGNEVLLPPQEFPQYPPPYFATFWLDPFGLMLEAVCHDDRE